MLYSIIYIVLHHIMLCYILFVMSRYSYRNFQPENRNQKIELFTLKTTVTVEQMRYDQYFTYVSAACNSTVPYL
jgi:hypothetical protein